jgi:hypothetical protein
MSFVPGYEYDVFISYASGDDDVANASDMGLVSQFASLFEKSLRMYLGSDEVRIFHDVRDFASNSQLERLLESARRSAVFLAVSSRFYATSKWTRRELDAFTGVTQDDRRLVAIEILPLDGDLAYPPPLATHKRMRFYELEKGTETPRPISYEGERHLYLQKVTKLVEDVQKQLKTMTKAAAGHSDDPAHVPSTGKRVLLAQVTDDLEDERETLRCYLEQFGIAVAPADPYPQDGEAFKAAFEADLARCDLFVQLLGRHQGRAPAELPEGYPRYQSNRARERGLGIAQWRRDDLDLGGVTNEDQRKLLSGESVIACGLERFKSEVLARTKTPQPAAPRGERNGSFVFIDASKEDTAIARLLQDEFGKGALSAAIPALEGDSESVRLDLEQNIMECSALLFVYGQSSPIWVRGQLRLYNKLKGKRSEPPRVLALYTGPPEEKPGLGFTLPEIREFDARKAVTLDPVHTIITELSR